MMRYTRFRRVNLSIPILFTAFLGVLLILFMTSRYGAAVSPDSSSYVSVAENLAKGQWYKEFDGAHHRGLPPLFSAILSLFSLAGVHPLVGARFFNSAAFGVIVAIGGFWMSKQVKTPGLVVLGTLVFLSGPPLVDVSRWVWSEPGFIILCCIFVFSLSAFLREPSWHRLALIALLSGLACLQRYAGLGVVLCGAMAILLVALSRRPLAMIAYGCLYCLIAVTPVSAWLTYDYLVTGMPWGEGIPSPRTLGVNVECVVDVITSWFIPYAIPIWVKLPFTAGIILSPLLLTRISWTRATFGILVREHALTLATILFVVCYTSFVVVSSTKYAINRPDNRYLAPIFVPVMVLAFQGLDAVAFRLKRYKAYPVVTAVVVLASMVWLLYPYGRLGDLVRTCITEGAGGYQTKVFVESNLIDYLKRHPLRGDLYSNGPDVIYLLTGIPALGSPVQPRELMKIRDAVGTAGTRKSYTSLERFRGSVSSAPNAYLVWFKHLEWRKYLYGLDELSKTVHLRLVQEAPDGAIYQIINK